MKGQTAFQAREDARQRRRLRLARKAHDRKVSTRGRVNS